MLVVQDMLSLICFARLDLSEQYLTEGKA